MKRIVNAAFWSSMFAIALITFVHALWTEEFELTVKDHPWWAILVIVLVHGLTTWWVLINFRSWTSI